MQPLPLQAFDHFTRVYDCVAASFDEMCRTTSGKLRRPATSIRWHFLLINLVVFVSWFFEPGPRIMLPLKDDLTPGYVHIVRHAAEKVQHDQAMTVLRSDDWRFIEAIARWKFDGINGRIQDFSFGIAAVGFFGILALVSN